MVVERVKSPRVCSPEEIAAFLALLKRREEVRDDNLCRRMTRARSLAFHYENGTLAGIIALKKASRAYLKKIETLARWRNSIGVRYEVGWAYVLEEYRNRGIASTLLDLLLSANRDIPTFSVTKTANQPVRSMLRKHGYVRCGSPYLWHGCKAVLYARPARCDDDAPSRNDS